MEKRGTIGGLPVDTLKKPEIFRVISNWWETPDKPRHIVTLNANMLMAAFKNVKLYRAIAEADLVTPDGYGIVRALLKADCPVQRITGLELLRDLLRDAALQDRSVYFYGGSRQVVRRLELILPQVYPRLNVRAIRDGFGTECTEEAVIRELQRNPPDLLCVGLGTPTQELFLHDILPMLGKTVGIGVGGALDVLAGIRDEAPGFIRSLGLEWLFRMVQDPRRLNRLPDLIRYWIKYLR